MRKYSGIIIVGLLTMLIGIVLSVQISTTSGSDQGGLVPLAKLKSYETELKTVRDEKEEALEQLRLLEERQSSIEKEKAEENVFIEGLVQDIEKYKMEAGLVDVEGTGVIVTISDPQNVDEYQEDFSVITYNNEQLLILINKLKEAGAEAISINEHRMVQTTEISLAGNHININGAATAPPYTIKAIGNPTTMSNALTIRGGIIEDLKKKYNLVVDISTSDSITIPRYDGVISFKYAKPIQKEEE